MIDQEIQLLLDEKQDEILTGMPVPQDGKIGDIRTNVFHKGKAFSMMKVGIDSWHFSAPFSRVPSIHTMHDYLLKSGGKLLDTSLLDAYDVTVRNDLTLSALDVGHIPYVGAGGLIATDNGQLFWDAANNRLGVGTATPLGPFHIKHSSIFTMPGALMLENSTGTSLYGIINSGDVLYIGFNTDEAGGFPQGSVSQRMTILADGGIVMANLKSGATQVAAGAATNELWVTNGHASQEDNTVMIGV